VRAKYAETIRNVNAALSSPVESIKDSTLLSVISLGVFEHVSEHKLRSQYVQGAAALVVARAKTNPSIRPILMFNQVRSDLVLACVHGEKTIPENIIELLEVAASFRRTQRFSKNQSLYSSSIPCSSGIFILPC
jgi:hypothetical protein